MRFSERSRGASAPNDWAHRADRIRSAGSEIDLTQSNPTLADIVYPSELLATLDAPGWQPYSPEPFGLLEARRAIAEDVAHEGRPADPTRVFIVASTSEAYAYLFKLLCDPGDEVLVPSPSYPLFEHLARLECVRIRPYRLVYDGVWHVDFDSVREALGSRCRAAVIVNPNNPTGSYLKRTELDEFASLGIPLISDEVFGPYPLRDDPTRADTVTERGDVLTFRLDGLSKRAGLPQAKVAWGVAGGPDALVEEAMNRLEVIADTFLSVATPFQQRLPTVLRYASAVRRSILDRARRNLSALDRCVRRTPVTALRTEGGWYAVVRLPSFRSEDEWLDALGHHGIIAQPGWLYDFEVGPVLVLSLLTAHAVFDTGIRQLVDVVQEASRATAK